VRRALRHGKTGSQSVHVAKRLKGCRISLPYCSLHKRLFSRRSQRWVTFSQATIDEVRRYYALLCATPTDASYLEVLERSCDQCAATFAQIAQVQRPKGGSSW